MKLKKHKKSRRLRGYRLHSKSAKKHKGKGSKGGKGMSGSGKRADQKKTYVLKYKKNYFGKKGLKRKKKLKQINLDNIKTEKKDIEFKNYKILGRGELGRGITIKANKFSKKAKEKIEKAGGKAVVIGKKKEGERKEPEEDKKGAKKEAEENAV